MKAYSMDLRQRVLDDCDAGMPTKQAALKYRVSPSWVRRLKQRRRENGEVAPRPCYNPRRPALEDHRATLVQMVAQRPDATLAELRDQLARERGVSVSVQTLWRALDGLKLTLKKSRCGRRSRTVPMFKNAAPCGV